MRRFFATSFYGLVLGVILSVSFSYTYAQVMQSPSYRIQSDSINFGGGLSTSTNYSLESTAGEIATGESSSASYNLFAGYQQMQEVFISLTPSPDIVMTPTLGGVTGGESNGSTTVTVITDSPSGYQLTIEASQSPAMRKEADSIGDYSPGAEPDFSFTTAANDSHFGYSPEGSDVVQRFLDDGGICNTGVFDTGLSCWDGLSTTAASIASDSDPNHPNGATTTIYFRVGIGGSVNQPPGTYTATTTLTALSL